MRLRAITSVVVPDDSYLRNAEDRKLFLSELALGGRRGDMSQSRRLAAIRVSLERLSRQPLSWALLENKTLFGKWARVDRTSSIMILANAIR